MRDRCPSEQLVLIDTLTERLLGAVHLGWEQGQSATVRAPVRRAVNAYLAQSTAHVAFHSVVSVLRRTLIPMVSEPEKLAIAEEVFYESVVCFGKKSWQLTGSHSEHVVSVERDLTQFRTDLSMSLEPADQLEVIARRLPRVGITRGLVFIYAGNSDDPYGQARLLLAFDDRGRHAVEATGVVDLPRGLTSAVQLINSARVSFIVEPLGDVGFLVLQMTDDLGMKIYVTARDIISFAFRSSMLLEESREQKDTLKVNLDKLQPAMEGLIETMGLVLEARAMWNWWRQVI